MDLKIRFYAMIASLRIEDGRAAFRRDAALDLAFRGEFAQEDRAMEEEFVRARSDILGLIEDVESAFDESAADEAAKIVESEQDKIKDEVRELAEEIDRW